MYIQQIKQGAVILLAPSSITFYFMQSIYGICRPAQSRTTPQKVKFHSHQGLQSFKQSLRKVKGQRQSVSFSEGDKAGNSGQY